MPSYFVQPASDDARADTLSVLARNLVDDMEYALQVAKDEKREVTAELWSDLGYPKWGQA